MDDDTEILVAAVNATLRHDGRRHHLARGRTLVRADDPVVEGRRNLFEPLRVGYLGRRPVEQATAAAGEEATAGPGELATAQLGEQHELGRPVEAATAAPGEQRDLGLVAKDVRAWAAEKGIEVPARGKLPDAVIEQYRAAHAGE